MEMTPDYLLNQIIMQRQADSSNTFFIVEGTNDIKVYEKFTANAGSLFFSSWGKDNLIELLNLLKVEKEVIGVIFILDSDFHGIDNTYLKEKNLFYTDFHDLEMMIINSDTFSTVIKEFCSEKKVERFGTFEDLRLFILQQTKIIGITRKFSIDKKLNISFENLDFEKFIDKEKLEINVSKFLSNLISANSGKNLKVDVLQKFIASKNSEFKTKEELSNISCGHDFMNVFALGLRKALATKNHQFAQAENVEGFFRIGYGLSDFQKTFLYKAIKVWEKKEKVFKTFA
jgi:5S rRNA maturation endonuclease (ribonuclease M5)